MKSLLRASGALDHALRAGADALAIDLADIAAPAPDAPVHPRLYIRIDGLAAADIENRIAAAVAARPHGLLLDRATGGAEVEHLAALLAVAEARAGLADGGLRIIASIGSGRGVQGLPSFAAAGPRLQALAWDAAALAESLGADSSREADGGWIEPLRHARSRLLTAAAALGLPAIDTASGCDLTGFVAEAQAARRHGFKAKIATGPDEVAALKAL